MGIFEDEELQESFLNHPPLQVIPNSITMLNIQQHQFVDLELNQQWQRDPAKFPVHFIDGRPLICWRENANDMARRWRIALPTVLVQPVVYQKNVQLGMEYGELSLCFASLLPWSKVAMDLIGLWKLSIGGQDVEFDALTYIDPVTNLVEMMRIDNKTAKHVAHFPEHAAESWCEGCAYYVVQSPSKFCVQEIAPNSHQYSMHDNQWSSQCHAASSA
eukprot:7729076-Ditylum_brightwellii.AAC.1